jgi:hypothetical protein
MSQLPAAKPSPANADPAATPVVEPGFEVQVQAFWNKNRNIILGGCVVVLLAIVAREGWSYFGTLREQSVQEDYAKVADKPDQLAAFADAHNGHVLAGVAYLQLADQKFQAADFKAAASLYTKASGSLKNDYLLGRSRVGAAISQISSGDQSTGEATLKAVSADQALPKDIRAEATYHLASLAAAAGKVDELQKLVGEVTKIDLTGSWSQRATMLLGNLQSGAKPAAGASPTITFKPEGK